MRRNEGVLTGTPTGSDGGGAQRGVAILSVVAVLVLLTLIATPFLITMRDGAARGRASLASAQAEQEAEKVFSLATVYLASSCESRERDAVAAGQDGAKDLLATPSVDTLAELEIPASVLASAGIEDQGDRVWGVEVQDEQAKIHLNSAPYPLLGYFLGRGSLVAPIKAEDSEMQITGGEGLPLRDGVVRVGTEVVRYARRQGGYLLGLQRGYRADRPGNGPAAAHGLGALVVNEAAFEIAAYPVLALRDEDAKTTTYAPYSNLYEARRIADLGIVSITPEQWEVLAEYCTVSSRRLASGRVFGDAQGLKEPLKAGEHGHRTLLRLDNPYRFGTGTTVRITDGVNTDYGVVVDYRGGTVLEVVPATLHDYDAGITRVEALQRHPVNLNTASRAVLASLLSGVGRHGQQPLPSDRAAAVADMLIKARPLKGLDHLDRLLDRAVQDRVLEPEEATAVGLNALNPQDAAPGFLALGTMPAAFRSGDVYTVAARAVVMDATGKELARREFRRIVEVHPRTTAVARLETQEELDETLRAGNSKWVTTFPVNLATWDGAKNPPSRFHALFKQARVPSRDAKDEQASVRLFAARLQYGGGMPAPYHYDNTEFADGYYLEDGAETYGPKSAQVGLHSDDGVRPFAVSLWFKPYWGGRKTAYILDGGKDTFEDRIALYYDGATQELVFRVADAGLERVAAEVRYGFDRSSWEDDRWYHLRAEASGTQPGQLTLLIDGESRGNPTLLTHLRQDVQNDATAPLTLTVDDASNFPATGALLLRGPDGVEVMHYESRTDTSFRVSKRYARLNRADTIDASPTGNGRTPVRRKHENGQAVTLYGYSSPIASDIPAGRGTLPTTLGRWNVLLLKAENPPDQWPQVSGGGGGGGGGGLTPPPGGGAMMVPSGGAAPSLSFLPPPLLEGPVTPPPGGGSGGGGLARGWGPTSTTISLSVSQDLAAWDGQAPAEALRAFGTSGYAVLASSNGDFYTMTGASNLLGAELVSYRVSGSSLTLTRQPELPPFLQGGTLDRTGQPLHFHPRHSYGDPNDPLTMAAPQGRLYGDSRITERGAICILVPISLEIAGAAVQDYLDPASDLTYLPRESFVQINSGNNTEWMKYDGLAVVNSVGSNLLAVRADRAQNSVSFLGIVPQQFSVPGGGGDDDPGDPTDPPDTPPTPPDTPPTPPAPEPDDPGGDPDAPPPPPEEPGGGEDDGPGGDPDVPPVPPDPGTPPEDDGPGGDPEPPPPPPEQPGGGEDDGPGGDPEQPPAPPEDPGGGEDDGPGGDPEPPPDPTDPGDPDDPDDPDDPGDPGDPGDPDDGDEDDDPTTDLPDNPASSGQATDEVPAGILLDEIGTLLDSRPTAKAVAANSPGLFIADTVASETHPAGTTVLPCFVAAFPGSEYDPQGDDRNMSPGGGPAAPATPSAPTNPMGSGGSGADPGNTNLDGRFVEPGPGYGDEVTVVVVGGDKHRHRINHSFHAFGRNSMQTVERAWTFVAFDEAVSTPVRWSKDLLGNDNDLRFAYSQRVLGNSLDARRYTRILKTPSGELPSTVPESVYVAARFDGGSFQPAVIDEVRFLTTGNANAWFKSRTYHVGDRPVRDRAGKNINADQTEIPLHVYPGYTGGTAASPDIRETGGVIRIDNELIGYARFDRASGLLTGCERGALGSEASAHGYEAPVHPVNGIAASRLESGLSETGAQIALGSIVGFPERDGYCRIGDEILGYTRAERGVLRMPEARQESEGSYGSTGSSARASGGLFRGRFGSKASAHAADAIVYHFEQRYEDRARELADDPAMAYYEVSREARGAVWKRISWDERRRPLGRVRAMVRFEGGPAWDSGRIVRVGTDAIPETNRRAYLYEISDPTRPDMLNVQSDRIEVRMFFVYEGGAWDPRATTAPDAWKETPWLQGVRLEYLAPTTVESSEDLR